jgi:UDP-glucose 4-epimerase
MKNIRYISHHAAIPSGEESVADPVRTNEVNINGTLNLLEEARNLDSLEKIVRNYSA